MQVSLCSAIIFWFLIFVACSTQGKTLRIAKTEAIEEGRLLDWVFPESQGKIASPPTKPKGDFRIGNVEDLFVVHQGPPGTVPILRRDTKIQPVMKELPSPAEDKHPQIKSSLSEEPNYQGRHWYASTAQKVFNLGGIGTFSRFKAYVETPEDFSLLQTAIIRRNATHAQLGSVIQTIEAGWINYPQQVQAPHLFSFFTTNGYSGYGDFVCGWNHDVAGFIQIDSIIYPGQPLRPYSVIGGAQQEIRIGYRLSEGNWWLYVGDRYIGYYPGILFSEDVNSLETLATGATSLNFYGEIYNSRIGLTTTDMGSGNFPESGPLHAAYIRNILRLNEASQWVDYDGSEEQVVSDPKRYRQVLRFNSSGLLGSSMELGGPGAGGVVGG